MYRYEWEKSLREDKLRRDSEKRKPSFSSTLLDKIYRSIDENDDVVLGEEPNKEMRNKHTKTTCDSEKQARLLDKWMMMDKKLAANDNVTAPPRRRQSLPQQSNNDDHLFFSSGSSSSDSSFGGFSSSETESVHTARTWKSRSSCFAYSQKPKPIRTSARSEEREIKMLNDCHHHCTNGNNNFSVTSQQNVTNSKSRALKLYDNLKKVKQPISPGNRITSFLNNLFANSKKSNKILTTTSIGHCEDLHLTNTRNGRKSKTSSNASFSACLSATSDSRSCLSKASHRHDKLNDGTVKRTVRFYPVSVIIDEDSRPCGHKCLYEEGESNLKPPKRHGRSPTRMREELKACLMEETRRVEEAARELLRGYQQQNLKKKNYVNIFKEDDDDDELSDSSSDLFELDHLGVNGKDSSVACALPIPTKLIPPEMKLMLGVVSDKLVDMLYLAESFCCKPNQTLEISVVPLCNSLRLHCGLDLVTLDRSRRKFRTVGEVVAKFAVNDEMNIVCGGLEVELEVELESELELELELEFE
ncbi:hypothetical protein RJ641_022448 [Dillenia turbinata]|uniref:Uncharacterized protein n=1 Tax=Dillenia turbinata TaxID=194707 RepID=A0AAN8UM04_9MAGN